MAFQSTQPDVVLLVKSPYSSSERRITPSWSIAQLKVKLEPVTGIPPFSQKLILKAPHGSAAADQVLEAADDETTHLYNWTLAKGAELHVQDQRPAAARPNFSDVSGVEKYTMPVEQYETLTDSVLAWKKAQKLGRFDPTKAHPSSSDPVPASQNPHTAEAISRAMAAGQRCQIADSPRRGVVRYVGPIPELPSSSGGTGARDGDGDGGYWVGIELDEPMGKNDGSVPAGAGKEKRKRYFECGEKRGVFVRPERVRTGDEFGVLDVDSADEEM